MVVSSSPGLQFKYSQKKQVGIASCIVDVGRPESIEQSNEILGNHCVRQQERPVESNIGVHKWKSSAAALRSNQIGLQGHKARCYLDV
jgi:hypothetical protein